MRLRIGGSDKVGEDREKDEQFPEMIRGEMAATSGAKSVARAQPMSALPGFILLSVLLQ